MKAWILLVIFMGDAGGMNVRFEDKASCVEAARVLKEHSKIYSVGCVPAGGVPAREGVK